MIKEEDIQIRKLYRHTSGRVFYLIGFASNEHKATVCIISNVADGKVHTRPVEQFYGSAPVYELVIPSTT